MVITLRLYATLKEYAPPGVSKEFSCEVPTGITVSQVARRLGIPPEDVHLPVVNGVAQDKEYVLAEGDSVALFPAIAGGACARA